MPHERPGRHPASDDGAGAKRALPRGRGPSRSGATRSACCASTATSCRDSTRSSRSGQASIRVEDVSTNGTIGGRSPPPASVARGALRDADSRRQLHGLLLPPRSPGGADRADAGRPASRCRSSMRRSSRCRRLRHRRRSRSGRRTPTVAPPQQTTERPARSRWSTRCAAPVLSPQQLTAAIEARKKDVNLRREIHKMLLEHLDLATIDAQKLDDPSMRPKVLNGAPPHRRAGLAQTSRPSSITTCSSASWPTRRSASGRSSASWPTRGQRDHGRRSEHDLRRAGRQDRPRRRALHRRRARARVSSSESSRRSVAASTSRRRSSTHASRTDPRERRHSARSRSRARASRSASSRRTRSRSTSSSSFGALTTQMGTFLTRCVDAKKNIVISGGTGSGKTTLLNVLSGAIPVGRAHRHHRRCRRAPAQAAARRLARNAAARTWKGRASTRSAISCKNALRMRPDRIVVGECRGGEALDMLQAMNTGHDGSLTTTHANSPTEAVVPPRDARA